MRTPLVVRFSSDEAGNWSEPQETSPINGVCIKRSDIMTFHSYSGPAGFKARAEATLKLGRPVICTEYLNRPGGCTYQALLPYQAALIATTR